MTAPVATALPPRPAADDGLPMPRRAIAAAAVLCAIVLAVLDGAIANVALPTISAELKVSASASVWVVTGYQLAVVVSLLPCAALGEAFGYRRVFTAGVTTFTAASALCALSPALPWLVGARFLQGLGSAAIMSLLAAMLRHTYPQRLLGRAIGWNALVVALSSAAGPTVGAGILSVATWHWLFAVNVPIGVLVLVASRALPRTEGHRRPLDILSVALNAGFFAPLVIGVDLIGRHALAAAATLAVAAVCLAALVRRELPRAAPLIPLDLLRIGTFRYSVAASICCFGAQAVSLVGLPFYLQHGLGQNPFMTGLYMTPWPLAVAVAAPLSGRAADRLPTAWLCAGGGFCFAMGLALAAIWPLESAHLAPLVVSTMVAGFGFGVFQTPNNRNMLLSAPKPRSGAAGGMQATARLIGQTSGAVAMSLLFSLLPAAAAPRVGLGVGAVLALCGGVASLMRAGR